MGKEQDNPQSEWANLIDDILEPGSAGSTGPKILLVDDSAFVRRDLRQTLAAEGYNIIEANDGLEGFKAVTANPDIALMFLDVNMPNLGGLELAERIAAEIEAKRLPAIQIIMLTTENTKDKVLRAKKAGVLGWIIKPANKEHIQQLAAKLAPRAA